MKYKENIYRTAGGIVSGDSFIGRVQELRELKERVWGNPLANAQIVGLPKVGKSSLMYRLKEEIESQWETEHCLVVWYTFNDYSDPAIEGTPSDVFLDIIDCTLNELKRHGFEDPYVTDYANRAKRQNIRFAQFAQEVTSFFDEIAYHKIRVLLCLDEFDYSKDVLTRVYYGLLRKLSYEKSYIGIVTTSRRTILDIEKDSGGGSSFYETCLPIYLKQFTDDEIALFRSFAGEIQEDDNEQISRAAGNHPYLNAIILSKYYNDGNMSKAIEDRYQEVLSYYTRLFTRVLKKDQLADKVLFIYSGFLDAVSQEEEDYILKKYGLFVEEKANDINEDTQYIPFCSSFDEYLRQKYRENPYNLTWPRAERGLRQIISNALMEIYGKDYSKWKEPIKDIIEKTNRKNGPEHYLRLEGQMASEISHYPGSGSLNLVDQFYPKDYYPFIERYWEDSISQILGHDLEYWKKRLEFIANKVRNPESHSRLLLDEKTKSDASLICLEIINCAEKKFGHIK